MNIAIIGAGNMGGALARGICLSKQGYRVSISNPGMEKLDRLKKEYPELRTYTDNCEAIKDSQLIILAVKPFLLPTVLNEITPILSAQHQTIVSLAASFSLTDFCEYWKKSVAIPPRTYIAIPTTSIAVGKGITFITRSVTDTFYDDIILHIFQTVGEATIIPEKLMPGATALCSCGIAFVYKYVQGCIQAGVQLGFKPNEALHYTIETISGAMAMLKNNGTTPQQEIDRVTTPGGITIKGINQLEHAGFISAILQGFSKLI